MSDAQGARPDAGRQDYTIHVATRAELAIVATLADRIWRASYPGIISRGQIDYMLERDYAIRTLEAERKSGILFLLLSDRRGPVGFGAYGPAKKPRHAKLHKLYLDTDHHGRGLGQRLLGWIESSARSNRHTHLVLQVNRKNARAIAAYQRNGYAIKREIVEDIGRGYVMDDFIMEKRIA